MSCDAILYMTSYTSSGAMQALRIIYLLWMMHKLTRSTAGSTVLLCLRKALILLHLVQHVLSGRTNAFPLQTRNIIHLPSPLLPVPNPSTGTGTLLASQLASFHSEIHKHARVLHQDVSAESFFLSVPRAPSTSRPVSGRTRRVRPTSRELRRSAFTKRSWQTRRLCERRQRCLLANVGVNGMRIRKESAAVR